MGTVVVLVVLIGAWVWWRHRRKVRAAQAGTAVASMVRGLSRRGHDSGRGGKL